MKDYHAEFLAMAQISTQLQDNLKTQFERYKNKEITGEQLTMYRREHYFRSALLEVASGQLADILSAEHTEHL